ncbi:hypothetical protein METP1_03129 [Methanosarcinales archaeon]|nr:hypothetical protein METP1_03129 [Methanosarcinales archaeon]
MNKIKTTVTLSKCVDNDIKKGVFNAISKTDFKSKKVNSVLIKPNLCYYWDYSTGETTDKRVVSAVIDYVREFCNPDANIRIAEADATAMKTRYVFKMLGYTDLAAEKNVELFNLCDDDSKDIEIKTKAGLLKIPLPRSMLDSDLIINVPKLKVPRRIPLTCAMKNLFGCIHNPVKARYHPYLHEVIAGVNCAIKPDLTVVDGIIALGRYPVKLDLIIAGTDSLAVDYAAAKIIGYNNPYKIKYLQLSKEMRSDNFAVDIIGEDINEIRRQFPQVNNFLFTLLWDLQLKGIKIYSRVTGDVVPPILGDL